MYNWDTTAVFRHILAGMATINPMKTREQAQPRTAPERGKAAAESRMEKTRQDKRSHPPPAHCSRSTLHAPNSFRIVMLKKYFVSLSRNRPE
jgi:hypothetical protein